MRYIIYIFLIMFVLVQITGCEKAPIYTGPGTNQLTNIAPRANAGPDLFVWSPVQEATLKGSYSDPENNIKTFSWTKILGPDSFTFSNKESLSTKVSDLEGGVYQFELTV